MIPDADKILRPQEGFQVEFLSTSADIAIGGGSAGGGKTFAELLEPIRHKDNPLFGTVMFRRSMVQITNQGGLWDTSTEIYPYVGAYPNIARREWRFPSGAKIKFTHLENDKTIYNHQGGQYGLIIFDELTHFTKKQFFYMLSRNRSVSGVKPYIRATTNPDPDSWVAEFLEWWIDQETGFPIPDRCGKLRFMMVHDNVIIWGNSKQEVKDQLHKDFFDRFPKDIKPDDLIKSVTFIPGSVYQNKELLRKDPGYLANLMAQDDDEKLRLMDGNWKIRLDGKALFSYFHINDLFTNMPVVETFRCITCDAARFGRDFTVIMVWIGYHLQRIIVMMSSDEQDIVNAIEKERAQFHVPKSAVLVDQDGVGGGAVKLGGYQGFHGGVPAYADPEIKTKEKVRENYENLKTQCYYRFANLVSHGLVAFTVNNETVIIIDRSGRVNRGIKIKVGGKETNVIELIKLNFKAIKKRNPDAEGKKKINTKEEQKLLLGGLSPDFSDCAMMRCFFDLKPVPKKPRYSLIS